MPKSWARCQKWVWVSTGSLSSEKGHSHVHTKQSSSFVLFFFPSLKWLSPSWPFSAAFLLLSSFFRRFSRWHCSKLIWLFLVGVFEEKERLLQWLVFCHFNAIGALFCSFVQLFGQFSGVWEAGERGLESRTKPQNFFMLPKVEGRPKGPSFGSFRHYATFWKLFEFFQRVPLEFFWSFRFVKKNVSWA